MKRFSFLVACVFLQLLVPGATLAAPFDTGFIEWSQPDEKTTFIARTWGDEFFWWMETDQGYRIVLGSDDWYYYASLDESGEFSPTHARVGLDLPPAESHQLDRSASRISVLNQEIAQFREQIQLNAQWFTDKQNAAMNIGQPMVLKLGVILIEFQDVTHYNGGNRPNGYLKADFDSMFFSQDYWHQPSPTPEDPSPHPENEPVFGSFRDYWWQMSRPNGLPGSLVITGKVVNPADNDGVPLWIRADNARSYYSSLKDWRALAYEAIAKADSLGYIDTADVNQPNYYDKLCIIYAQDARYGGSLSVHAERVGGRYYLMAERNGYRLYGTQKAFSHIGTHLHEFGHTIGFDEQYTGTASDDGNTNLFLFDVMAWGLFNGPNVKGECPATLSPYYRIQKRWVTPIQVWFNTTNLEVQYNYSNPQVYRIDPRDATDNEHYLFETRLRQGFDSYIPTPPDSFVYQPGTLLVWHHNASSECLYHDRIRLKHADNTRAWGSLITDFFPSNASSNRQSLNDATTPAATLGSPDLNNHECDNERLAHFALNGIHRDSSGNTLIDTVSLYYKYVSIPVANAWHMLSVPVTLGNYLKPVVFPGATSAAFVYVSGSGYVQKDTLKNGPGYFIKFGATGSLVLGGNVRETDTAFVSANWNLVGSITDTIDTANVCLYPYPSNKRLTPFYRYENGYVPDSLIVPGRGYWVKVLLDGEFVFHHDPVECGGGGVDFATSEFDHFIITDAEGRKQDVYVANLDRDPSLAQIDLSMPPPFPDAVFDARFEAGEFVKAVSPDSGVVELTINVETEAYPVTVTWELNPENGIEYSVNTEGMGKKQGGASLTRSGSSVMTNSSGGKFRLNAEVTGHGSKNVLPTVYMLAQNYPNPFNPSTQIHYELPHDGQVKLVVYDVLGREVATLVNDVKAAGRYDASVSTTGLASGVYFYRLQAGSFVNTKKMILLK